MHNQIISKYIFKIVNEFSNDKNYFFFLQGNHIYPKDSYSSSLHTYFYLIAYVIVSIDTTIINNTFFF